ncbi:MAG: PQQ-binding-like beta-propeller repeat protein, partial [Mariniblastus sp.]|nr:PQQ-binding-like beta-propeller repeat protein [Mariniblastus sp.]
MSPQQLVEKLEALGFVDEKTINKIRREVADPKKKPSVKQILNYLIKKGLLTEMQAKNIISQNGGAGAAEEKTHPPAKPKAVEHEVIKVSKPKEEEFDTNDLTANVNQELEAPAAPSPGKTEIDQGLTRQDVIPVPSQAPNPADDATRVVAVQEIQPVDYMAEPLDAFGQVDDPLNYQADDPYLSGGQPAQPQAQTLHGFKGKRDQSNQWQNKWLFIGFGILGTLIIVGTLLVFATGFVTAEDRFKAAMDSFENGTYKDAITKFTDFIERYPGHEKTSTAKVRRVQSMLADTYTAKNWDETIKRAQNELPKLEDDEDIDFGPVRDDLAYMLPTSTLSIAKRASKQPTIELMEKELEWARTANAIVDNPVYIPGSTRKSATVAKLLDDIANTIAACEGLIRKEEDYDKALVEIQELSEQSKTDEAFVRYTKLIRQYGDLAAREQLRSMMKGVSQQEQQLVKAASVEVGISQEEPETAVKSTIILASKTGNPIEGLAGEVLPVLSDGSIFGVDLGDGSVRWRRFVGFQTTIQPVVFDAESILISNQTTNELMRVDAKSGDVMWRAALPGPFNSPSVNEKQIVLSTLAGQVLNVDADSGKILTAVQLPQKTGVNPTFSPRNPYLYQPGYYSNLYVLSAEDLSCQEVYYLGQYKGSISVPIVFWSGYLLIAENGSDACDLHVLRPTDNGLGLEPVQKIRRVTTGPVNSPMIRFGRWLLITADNGDMKILELNTSNDQNPISTMAADKFENREGSRLFLLAEGSQLWIAGKGIQRYKIQRAMGQFNKINFLNHNDFFLGPMAKYGNTLVHNRRRAGSGHVSVSGVDSESLQQSWRSDISGPLAGSPILRNGEMLAVSSQGDLFTIDPASEYSDAVVKSSNIEEDLLFDQLLPFSEDFVVAVGPAGRPDILAVDLANKTTEKLTMQSPADQTACQPVRVGNDLVVASRQGHVLRINPQTGRAVGAPFLPPVNPGKTTDWKGPAVLGDTQFVIPDSGGVLYQLSTENPRNLQKISSLNIETPVKSPCVALGSMVYTVIGGDTNDEVASFQTNGGLSPVKKVPLAANVSAGPWIAGDTVILKLDNDQLVCLDADLNEKWSMQVPNDRLACPPFEERGGLNVLFQSGKIWLVDTTNG